MLIIILPAKGKVHTVSPLFTKNVCLHWEKMGLWGREIYQRRGDGIAFYLVFKYIQNKNCRESSSQALPHPYIHKRILVK